MKDQVVNPKVPVDQGGAMDRLVRPAGKKAHHILHVRQRPDRLPRLLVPRRRLGLADGLPRVQLAGIEAGRAAEGAEADRARVEAVQAGQDAHGVDPHGGALGAGGGGHGRVLEDAAVEEGHEVEGRADDGRVLAQGQDARDRHVGGGQGGQHAVLALDLVGLRGQHGAGRLLAQHVARARRRRELVGRVGLPEGELLHGERHVNLGDMLRDPGLKGADVDGVADGAGHGGASLGRVLLHKAHVSQSLQGESRVSFAAVLPGGGFPRVGPKLRVVRGQVT